MSRVLLWILVLTSLAALLCACSRYGAPHPLPLPERIEPAEVQANAPGVDLPATNSSTTAAAKAVLEGIRVSVAQDALPRRDVDAALLSALAFLHSQFGDAPGRSAVAVEVHLGGQHHAYVSEEGGERVVRLSALNVYGDEIRHVVHELFHALYQPGDLLYDQEAVVEGWAAYAEYRFVYAGQANQEIASRLRHEFGLEGEGFVHEGVPNGALSTVQANRKYVSYALRLLDRDHAENVSELRLLLAGGGESVSAAPAGRGLAELCNPEVLVGCAANALGVLVRALELR